MGVMAKGAPLLAWAYLCDCDDDCRCSWVMIGPRNERFPNGMKAEWVRGTFFNDDMFGDKARAELNRVAKTLRKVWHDVYEAIEWPWDRSDDHDGGGGGS